MVDLGILCTRIGIFISELKKIHLQIQSTKQAEETYKKAKSLHAQAEAETQDAHQLIGIYKKQNIRTKGTLYNFIGLFRTELLMVYQGNEEELSKFGFDKPGNTLANFSRSL